MASKCAFPGCAADLYPGNRTGLCRTHNHTKGICSCVQCGGPAPAQAQIHPPVTMQEPLPVKTQVLVPYQKTSGQTNGTAKVSLAPDPWGRRQ